MKTFYWLVKLEFWEHRGSFVWAPVITGGIVLLLTLMSIITGEVFRARGGVHVNGIDFNTITAHMGADALDTIGKALDISILTPVVLIGSGALGALYEGAFTALDIHYTVIDADEAVRRGLLAAANAIWP